MTDRPAVPNEDIAVALFGELFMADQLARNRITKALPKGMELSHFSVLNHLARLQDERTPAQLANCTASTLAVRPEASTVASSDTITSTAMHVGQLALPLIAQIAVAAP